jgi:hypothetical protein
MAMQRQPVAEREALRPLRKHEIDRRIESLVMEVAATAPGQAKGPETLHPRWIAPAELVRRMRRFVVYN